MIPSVANKELYRIAQRHKGACRHEVDRGCITPVIPALSFLVQIYCPRWCVPRAGEGPVVFLNTCTYGEHFYCTIHTAERKQERALHGQRKPQNGKRLVSHACTDSRGGAQSTQDQDVRTGRQHHNHPFQRRTARVTSDLRVSPLT